MAASLEQQSLKVDAGREQSKAPSLKALESLTLPKRKLSANTKNISLKNALLKSANAYSASQNDISSLRSSLAGQIANLDSAEKAVASFLK